MAGSRRAPRLRWAAPLAIASLWAPACGGPQEQGRAGAVCFRDDECQSGFICVAPALDPLNRVCSDDPTPLISNVEGPPPLAVTGGTATAEGGSPDPGGTGGVPAGGGTDAGNAGTGAAAGGAASGGRGGSGSSGGNGNAGGIGAGSSAGGSAASGGGGGGGGTASTAGTDTGGTSVDVGGTLGVGGAL